MAQLNTEQGGGGKKDGKVKQKKSSTHIDMTPMVDLAFLLLTFFMLTTTFSKPKTMEVNMPVKPDNEEQQQKVAESLTLTVLLGKDDKVVWYQGVDNPTPMITDLSATGLRKTLIQKNSRVFAKAEALRDSLKKGFIKTPDYKKRLGEIKQDKLGLIVLIKSMENANYENLVDVLDEMAVCHIGRYAIVDITPVEIEMIEKI
ncbi:MAG: ExbD/TolR family protein [Bacteroidota bacterium]